MINDKNFKQVNNTIKEKVIEAYGLVTGYNYKNMTELLLKCERYGIDFDNLFFDAQKILNNCLLPNIRLYLNKYAIEKLNRHILSIIDVNKSILPNSFEAWQDNCTYISSSDYCFIRDLLADNKECRAIFDDYVKERI